MKTMNKIITSFITVLSLGLVFTNGVQAKTAWHSGTPKIMQGIWKDSYNGYKTRIANKKGLYLGPKAGTDKSKYKYLGNHRYLIKRGPGFKTKDKFFVTKHKLYNYSMKSWFTR